MTRTGKIARLPPSIREELNLRLHNGEQGKDLVQWLNSLPPVIALMKAQFDGQPIAENNLSVWKTGGYLAWEQNLAIQTELESFLEKARGLQMVAKESLSDGMALFLTAQMAREFNQLDSLPDGEEKSKAWRNLLDKLVLLRRGECLGEKLRLDHLKALQLEKEQRRRKEERAEPMMTTEEKKALVRQVMGLG